MWLITYAVDISTWINNNKQKRLQKIQLIYIMILGCHLLPPTGWRHFLIKGGWMDIIIFWRQMDGQISYYLVGSRTDIL